MPSPLISILIGLIWSVVTYVNSAKIILPPIRLPGQIKFRLQLFFFGIKSISIGNNTKKTKEK